MLDKSISTTDKYKLNHRASLVVRNVKIVSEGGSTHYRTDFTLKYREVNDKPFVFSDVDEVADFLGNLDIEDNQMSLFEENSKKAIR